MLKIKDNVDLKELEKYGFEFDIYENGYTRICYGSELDADEIIIREDRIINNWTCLETYDDAYSGESELDDNMTYKIGDLIKDGLVEKV